MPHETYTLSWKKYHRVLPMVVFKYFPLEEKSSKK